MSTSYAEMDKLRKLARPFYLEMHALGLSVRAEEDPEDPSGYALTVRGLQTLEQAHADYARRRITALKPGLLQILTRSKWDGDLNSVLQEARAEASQ